MSRCHDAPVQPSSRHQKCISYPWLFGAIPGSTGRVLCVMAVTCREPTPVGASIISSDHPAGLTEDTSLVGGGCVSLVDSSEEKVQNLLDLFVDEHPTDSLFHRFCQSNAHEPCLHLRPLSRAQDQPHCWHSRAKCKFDQRLNAQPFADGKDA
ncbi:hypothetical protein J3459_016553 [Metarhizium acridum]|nr:hypothetical protein J3459_016553 [Metarhizium acridum]